LVLAYPPQRMKRSLATNSNYQPQGFDGTGVPTGIDPLLTIYPPIADNTFQFYKFYQVKKNQVPSTQTNMPLVIIDTLGSGIFQEASGFDIRAFDSTGSPLNYEVESITTGTGDFVIHVNVTTVQDGEFIQLTFGKPSATDGSNSGAVYDSNYSAVYHSNQTTFGLLDTKDSTVNNFDGTSQNMDSTDQVPGPINGSLEYNGSDEFIIIPSNSKLEPGSGPFTASCLVENDAPTERRDPMGKQVSASPFIGWLFRVSESGGDGKLWISLRDSLGRISVRGSTVTGTGKTLLGFTYDGSGNASGVKLYVNGLPEINNIEEDTLTLPVSNTSEFNIARSGDDAAASGLFFDGIADEVTLEQIERTADYMKIKANNQLNNNAFWFKTPLLENGEDNFLVDDMDRNIVAVQS